MRERLLRVVCVAACLIGGAARADVVWDYSPDATHAAVVNGSLDSTDSGQNFVESVGFASSVTITGMDIYSDKEYGALGDDAAVKIMGYDTSGKPQGILDYITAPIDAIDTQGTISAPALTRKHVDFESPVILGPGAYWIGMCGAPDDITQAMLQYAGGEMAYMYGRSYLPYSAYLSGTMAFRLDDGVTDGGSPVDVPEPVSVALLSAGFAAVGLMKRRP